MQSIAALAALLPLVAAHGFVQDPPAREPGDAFKAACGEQPYYQQTSDINGNVQGILQVVGSDFDASKCNLWLCKGFLLADNPDRVQSYTAGQVVDFTVNIAAPHTGIANVSVVSTSTNTIIGEPLIEFENYAANAGVAANNTAFSVTIPSDLGSSCTTAGDCVLQWFWDAEGINQTYESCIDFTVGGSSSGGDSGSASSAVASSAAATEAAATTAAAATSAAAVTEPAVVTSAITPVAPVSTDAAAVTSEAPAATSAAADDDECPADEDEGDDEGDDEEGDDDDCDLDDGDDEDEGDDEDCDLDGEETDIETAGASATDVAAVAISSTSTSATTTAAAVQTGSGSGSEYDTGSEYGSGSNNGAGSATKPAVTSYITVTGKPHTRTQVQTKYVTVTAEAAACT